MIKQTFKSRIKSDKVILGTFLQIPAAEIAEIVRYSGFEAGIVDAEHGMMGVDASIQIVRGCDAAGLISIYRVPEINHHRIGHALDTGVSAVMVPNITSKKDAELVVSAAKYNPEGTRGVCPFTRSSKYNAVDRDPDYYNRSNRETAIILQIEGIEGLSNLDEILEVPHIDCIFIGPFDLSQSLGIIGKITDDRVLKAIQEILQKAEQKGIAVGNFVVTPEQANRYIEIGVRFIAYGADTMIVSRAYYDLGRLVLTP